MLSKKIRNSVIILALITGFLGIETNHVEAKVIPRTYTISDASTYELTYKYTITNINTTPAQNIEINIPLGTYGDESPYITKASSFTTLDSGATIINNSDLPGLKINFSSMASKESKVITVKRNIQTGAINYEVNNALPNDYSDFENHIKYTSPELYIESDNSQIKQKADEITQSINNPYDKAKAIYDFVVTSMTYTTDITYANKGAISALINKTGVYQDYSDLFVALCRAKGIPARAVYGYRTTEQLSGTASTALNSKEHTWAEFYLPQYGWIIAEPANKDSGFARNNSSYEHIFSGYTLSKGYTVKCNGVLDNSNNIKINFDTSTQKIGSNENIQVTPYSSYASRLDEAKSLVDKAESSGIELDISNAEKLVNTLMDGQEKTDLLNRIKNIIPYKDRVTAASNAVHTAEVSKLQADIGVARLLVSFLKDTDKVPLEARLDLVQKVIEATNAVVKAEGSRAQTDVNYAIGLVNALPIGNDRSGLLSRLDKVQAIINNNIAEQQALTTATNEVIKAESSKSQTDVNYARNLVNALPIGNDKNNLVSRLDAIQAIINNNTPYQQALNNAINAVVKAEGSRAQTDVNYARDLVNALPIGNDKNNLISRLDAIQVIINNNTPYQQALSNAINAIVKAEGSRAQTDVNYARDLVNALPSGNDKNNLVSRLDAIQAIINNNTPYQQALSNAINAVNRAEGNRTQTDVNYARDLVNALPSGNDRNNLLSRLDTIQSIINNNTPYQQTLNNAINAVNRAESSRTQTDVNYARSLVNSLTWGSDRSSLSNRLDLVQRIIDDRYSGDTNYYRQLNDATNAVIRAENFRLQADIDSARILVNNLNYENRVYLRARLDAVQAISNNWLPNQQGLINIANDAVIRAERNLLQNDVDSARALVNALSDGTYKTSLNSRLNIAQNVISNRYYYNGGRPRQQTILDNRIVNPYKVWTISFDSEIELNNSNKQNIIVTDSRGNWVNVNVMLNNNRSITVLNPNNGYTVGERYVLNIRDGVRSKNGKRLNRDIKMNFTIRR